MAETRESTTVADQTSAAYLGRWNHLVSTTNWEKGRIIHEWRSALIAETAPIEEYSDEAWAARVGGVSGQHVGRLRRVFERFGASHDDYKGLYWSHFQAANEWHDAEMWLEGAVQNDWSVAGMRNQRAEALGEVATEEPTAPESWDDDAGENETATATATKFDGESTGPSHEGPDFGDDGETVEAVGERSDTSAASRDPAESGSSDLDTRVPINPLRPFAELPALPLDLSEAFEELKLAILRHKVTNWQEVGASAIQDHLNALAQMLHAGA